ncbi:DUF771 domain-containing protein [Ligilactobacillus acidipiscis]|uniref:DUF771 domain-containing protein n=1 Tax=Ligilactobacillus acidipiscis TaxID=89059 RepID=UPI0023F7E2D7|nr:DUF771 domain-containing protein [Ligilactobacillus acidipiscis]WEV56161.1 DUF771 domain-containing protein [Ligilactobacillus acidipiscis]
MSQQIAAHVTIQVPADKVIVDKADLKEIVNQNVTGKTWGIEEFRKACCGNKAREWVRLYIFSKFENEISIKNSNGWLLSTPKKAIIFAKPACDWMEKNRNRIDWEARMP